MVKGILIAIIVAVLFDIGLIFGIDAEVARRDREFGRTPQGCLFKSNCWAMHNTPESGNTLAEKIYASLQK